MITRINATFTSEIFTTSTEAIISTIDADGTYVKMARIAIADLGTVAPADYDQDDVIDGLKQYVEQLAARMEMYISNQDGDGDNLFWTLIPALPIDIAAAKHRTAVAAERLTRVELYAAIREQVRQGMPVSHAAVRAGVTRVTVDRVIKLGQADTC